MDILPPQQQPEMTAERYLAALAIGWEPKAGVRVFTTDPVPKTGGVGITTLAYVDGQPVTLPPEPFPSEHLAKWRGYSLDMHGWFALDPARPLDPAWRVFEDDGTLLYTLELDRIRIQAAGSGLFAELLVLPIPDRPLRTGLFGWDHRIPPTEEVEKAVRALELLGLVRQLEGARRGRPKLYDEANEPQFFEDLKEAAHAAVRAGERLSYSSLKRHWLASRKTITDGVERLGYDLDAIEAEAVRCTWRANICTFIWRDRAKFKKKRL
jgi:hypothetical protein